MFIIIYLDGALTCSYKQVYNMYIMSTAVMFYGNWAYNLSIRGKDNE